MDARMCNWTTDCTCLSFIDKFKQLINRFELRGILFKFSSFTNPCDIVSPLQTLFTDLLTKISCFDLRCVLIRNAEGTILREIEDVVLDIFKVGLVFVHVLRYEPRACK